MKNLNDIECMQEIAKIILTYAPRGFNKIIFTSQSEPYGVYRLKHEYVDEEGNLKRFYYDDPVCGHYISEYLSQHKTFYMDKGLGEWKHFVMNIDLDTGKVSVDLKYE